jgi:hypothetical protein
MENEVPVIQPKTWESAAGLCAWQIDKAHKSRFESMQSHPSWTVSTDWLNSLREEYDGLMERWYGSDDGPIPEWFKSLASTALFAAYTMGATPSLTAESILPLLERKQNDYGYENINRFGRDGILVRMHDKIARIENLADRIDMPSNESLADSFVDLVGYSIIGMMWEYEIWHLPMVEDQP